jgi:hypothetical protein
MVSLFFCFFSLLLLFLPGSHDFTHIRTSQRKRARVDDGATFR